MTARIQTYDQFVDSWGNLSNKIEKMDNLDYVNVFDYINYDERCVWVVCGETEDVILEGPGDVILHDENKLGFIPFAISRWGNSLSDNTAEQVMPLLQSVEGSGQWDMLNVLDSLDASLAIKRAARPSVAGEFPPGQSPEMDNTQPEGVLELPQGTRNFAPLPSQSVDNRLAMDNSAVKTAIGLQGEDSLPIVVLDGTIISVGGHPTRSALLVSAGYKASDDPGFLHELAALAASMRSALASNKATTFFLNCEQALSLGLPAEDLWLMVESAKAASRGTIRDEKLTKVEQFLAFGPEGKPKAPRCSCGGES